MLGKVRGAATIVRELELPSVLPYPCKFGSRKVIASELVQGSLARRMRCYENLVEAGARSQAVANKFTPHLQRFLALFSKAVDMMVFLFTCGAVRIDFCVHGALSEDGNGRRSLKMVGKNSATVGWMGRVSIITL